MLFRWMITPSVTTIIWTIGVVLITVASFVGMIQSISDWDSYLDRPDVWQSMGLFLGYVLVWLLSMLFFRIFLELTVVLFSILNFLRDIDSRGRGM